MAEVTTREAAIAALAEALQVEAVRDIAVHYHPERGAAAILAALDANPEALAAFRAWVLPETAVEGPLLVSSGSAVVVRCRSCSGQMLALASIEHRNDGSHTFTPFGAALEASK